MTPDPTHDIQLQRLLRHTSGMGTLLRLVTQDSHLAVCVLTAEGRYVYASAQAEAVLGRTAAELVGMPSQDTIHPDDVERVSLSVHRQWQQHGTAVVEYRHLHPTGQVRWCEANLGTLPGPDGQDTLVVSLIRDIHQRREALTALQESESRKAAMLNATLDAVIGVDSHGRVVEWNEKAERVFGFTASEAFGQELSALIVPPELVQAHREGLARHRDTGEERIVGRQIEVVAQRRSGERLRCQMLVVPFQSGGERHYLAYLRDLSAQDESGRRLLEHEQELRLLAGQLPSVLIVTDRELRVRSVHGTLLTDFGLDPARLIGTRLEDVVEAPIDRETVTRLLNAALAGQAGQHDASLRGREFSVQVEPAFGPYGEVIGTISLAVEVTARLRAQRAERARTGVLQDIAYGAPVEHTLRQVARLLTQHFPGGTAELQRRQDTALLDPVTDGPPLPTPAAEDGDAFTVSRERTGPALAAATGEPSLTADVNGDPGWGDAGARLAASGVRACWAVPVTAKGGAVLGTLAVYLPRPGLPGEGELTLLTDSARLAGIALERDNDLRQITVSREETLRTLGLALELRDYETKGHTDRVVDLSERLGQALQLTGEELRALRWGAYLHDVGKMVVPDHILLKPGAPTPEEWQQIRRHPEAGFEMLRNIPTLPAETLQIVRHHHEHWNGFGYPLGLAGTDIPYLARLFAVVDVYDALTTARPYKDAWTPDEALAELRRSAGRTLDPDLVDAFTRLHDSPG